MPITQSFAGLSGFGFGVFPGADFESIATVTVGSGGAANIEFTSIPSPYQHLQIRAITKCGSASGPNVAVRVNGDTGSSYSWHYVRGTGSAASAGAGATQSLMILSTNSVVSSSTTSVFGAITIDILDYANTSKYSTLRAFYGADTNGAGEVGIASGLWQSTSAISSIKVYPDSATFGQYTTAALYGIKAP